MTVSPLPVIAAPDQVASQAARATLAGLDVTGPALGSLADLVGWAASVQGTPRPGPFQRIRVLLLTHDHQGDLATGADPASAATQAEQASHGLGSLALLAERVGADIQVISASDLPGSRHRPSPKRRERLVSGPVESGDAMPPTAVELALTAGQRLGERAAEDAVDLLVLATAGAGADAAAAVTLAAASGAEVAGLLPRVVRAGGLVDDVAWMTRCTAARDALFRTRGAPRDAMTLLAALGGADLSVATGLLIGAAAAGVPVVLDGPVAATAAFLARDLVATTPYWCLLPDYGSDPVARLAGDLLGLHPVLDLRLGLGFGSGALAALPLLQTALAVAANGQPENAEPAAGPADDTGPATTGGPAATADPVATDPSPTADTAADAPGDEPDDPDGDSHGAAGKADTELPGPPAQPAAVIPDQPAVPPEPRSGHSGTSRRRTAEHEAVSGRSSSAALWRPATPPDWRTVGVSGRSALAAAKPPTGNRASGTDRYLGGGHGAGLQDAADQA